MLLPVPSLCAIIVSVSSVVYSLPGEDDIFTLIRQGQVSAVRKLVAAKPELLVPTEIVSGNDFGQK